MSKNVNNRKAAPKLIFFNEKKIRKIWTIFDVENWLWKSEFCNFQQLLPKFTKDLKKSLGSSLAFTLKEGPVRCVKVWNKSWVILCSNYLYQYNAHLDKQRVMIKTTTIYLFTNTKITKTQRNQSVQISDSLYVINKRLY